MWCVTTRAEIKALRKYADCSNCTLRDKPTVYGFGRLSEPEIAFIGEAPGEEEIDEGRPFVGKAGKFLRVILKAVGIDETQCYFTNTCICRPNNNRKPTVKMIRACKTRLIREVSLVRPKLIVTLGGVPTSGFLDIKRGITKSHGEYKLLKFKSGFTVGAVATYHPSGVMRAPDFYIDFCEELAKAKGILEGEVPVIQPPYHNYIAVTEQAEFEALLLELTRHQLVACDIETDVMDWTTGKILCIGFSWEREHAWIVDWEKLLEGNLNNLRLLNDALAYTRLSFQNGMYDVPFMLQYGLSNTNYFFDTMFAHYLLDERQNTHSLERLAIRYYKAPAYKSEFRESLGIRGYVSDETWSETVKQSTKKELFNYNGADTDYTFRLTQDLGRACKREGVIPILRDIEMPAAKMFMQFHIDGMLVDRDYWLKMATEWKRNMDRLMKEMRAYPGAEELNFNSPKQLAAFLYDELGLLPFGGEESFKLKKISEADISKAIVEVNDPEAREYWTSKRTQMSEGLKGAGGEAKGLTPRSTTTYMLYYLRQQHEWPSKLIQYRHIKKRFSMYYKGIKKDMWKDGRVHPEYDMCATRTGRKASKHPPIHNLPRGDEIYNIYITDPGWVNIHADYKTAEMRMMAHYAKDWHLLTILDTMDIHSVYAMEIFNLTKEEFNALDKSAQKNMRIASKMITFGIPYGRSASGLAPQLGKTVEECEVYIETYFRKFAPRVKKWLAYVRALGIEQMYLRSESGRLRRFPYIRDKYHKREVERQLGNFMIQTTINELTLLAQLNSLKRLTEEGIPCRPWPHIHDSLNILVPRPLWKSAVPIIDEVMNQVPFETKVSFPAEIEAGVRWGEMTVVMEGGIWTDKARDLAF